MNPPQIQEYPTWYKPYIDLVNGDVLEILEKQITEIPTFINSIAAKADYAYAPGKWTIKELLGHIIDTERVMAYRLLCFARNDKSKLPGFDENEYASSAHFADRSIQSLAEEFAAVRKANMFLLNSLNEEELSRTGIANNNPISVKALVFILAGHAMHHINIVKERYL